MGLLGLMGDSLGCSADGERLVSAARDGDLVETRQLLNYNPRLVRYSTFGSGNSPLHYSAAIGHLEMLNLLLECGVDINIRNYSGQTALMLACKFGHWEIVQTLVILGADILKRDSLNGGMALHYAAINGHSRCLRLLLADYVPSVANIITVVNKRVDRKESIRGFDKGALLRIVNKTADGGVTALHMTALNGHVESTLLLLDLGASVYSVTVDDGSTIDLIGTGSTPLHYAACGGNAHCCQLLIAKGASLTTKNANGWNPSMVARSWHKHWLKGILSKQYKDKLLFLPSPYLSLPLMSIVNIARECGWMDSRSQTPWETCVVCLERACSVSAEGCKHEFCTRCALYLCSTNSTSTPAPRPAGSIACPLCRNGIASFVKLPGTLPLKELSRTSLLSLSARQRSAHNQNVLPSSLFCTPNAGCTRISSSTSRMFSAGGYRKLPLLKFKEALCKGVPQIDASLITCRANYHKVACGDTLKYSRKTRRRTSNSQPSHKKSVAF